MIKEVEVKKLIVLDIPDERRKEMLESYKNIIQKDGEESDMIEHIAYNIAEGRTFVEGIGELSDLDINFSTSIEIDHLED